MKSLMTVFRFAIPCIFLVVLLGCQGGCGTLGGTKDEVVVSLLRDGRLEVEGKTVEDLDLARAVSRAGAGEDTRIVIELQEDTPRAQISAIGRRLSAAGYHKFIFHEPIRAESSVGTEPN